MFSATGLVPDLLQLIIIGEANLICNMKFSAKRPRLMGDLNLEWEEGSLYGGSPLAKGLSTGPICLASFSNAYSIVFKLAMTVQMSFPAWRGCCDDNMQLPTQVQKNEN